PSSGHRHTTCPHARRESLDSGRLYSRSIFRIALCRFLENGRTSYTKGAANECQPLLPFELIRDPPKPSYSRTGGSATLVHPLFHPLEYPDWRRVKAKPLSQLV